MRFLVELEVLSNRALANAVTIAASRYLSPVKIVRECNLQFPSAEVFLSSRESAKSRDSAAKLAASGSARRNENHRNNDPRRCVSLISPVCQNCSSTSLRNLRRMLIAVDERERGFFCHHESTERRRRNPDLRRRNLEDPFLEGRRDMFPAHLMDLHVMDLLGDASSFNCDTRDVIIARGFCPFLFFTLARNAHNETEAE